MNKNDIPDIFKSGYNAADHESSIYALWEKTGFFNPDVCIEKGHTDADAETYSIVLPPPNVTGVLHIGHAAMLAIEDIVVRYNRMSGKRTLWIPGTDHAAIATQSKVEKILTKEKLRKHDLGREEFLKRVEAFAQESHDTIVSQIKVMGASVDWSREAFTLDEKREKAVRTAFKTMFDDELIYQKERVVNWDPKGQTVISDDEIVHVERDAKLYTFKYSEDFPIPVATTRPETKLGDTGVAVHPEGKYKEYIGQTFETVFCGQPLTLKVVGDDFVDEEFGTGAVGLTPAHSKTDEEIAARHDVPMKQIINEYAQMCNLDNEEFDGLKTAAARDKVIEKLTEAGLLIETQDIKQNVSTAERTGAVIEPLPKLQWWIDVNKEFVLKYSEMKGIESGATVTLKSLMQHAVRSNAIDILPERFEKTYFDWIDNLKDWCISRQIWYGHQIPVWYKDGEIYAGLEAPAGDGWTQESDTLDTWFSSGLWTFSTLGWPEETKDLLEYHPTNLLETGYDILFFWVARMILMSTYLRGQIPFETVYLHGLVRDAQGAKMSKSVGNVIDPVEVSDKYGADAVRLSLIIGIGPGQDAKLSEDKIRAYKKFSNKIWNGSRFVLENGLIEYFAEENKPDLTPENQNEIDVCLTTIKEVTGDIESYKLYLAGEKLYHYFWHTFADEIIERNKEILHGETSTDAEKASASYTIYKILTLSLKALHPFVPFVTETIWQHLPYTDTEHLIVSPWPVVE